MIRISIVINPQDKAPSPRRPGAQRPEGPVSMSLCFFKAAGWLLLGGPELGLVSQSPKGVHDRVHGSLLIA